MSGIGVERWNRVVAPFRTQWPTKQLDESAWADLRAALVVEDERQAQPSCTAFGSDLVRALEEARSNLLAWEDDEAKADLFGAVVLSRPGLCLDLYVTDERWDPAELLNAAGPVSHLVKTTRVRRSVRQLKAAADAISEAIADHPQWSETSLDVPAAQVVVSFAASPDPADIPAKYRALTRLEIRPIARG